MRRVMPVVGTPRRLEKELRQKSQAACDRLTLEVERKSQSARSKMALIRQSQSSNMGETGTRLLVIELIQEHNRIDVYKMLCKACQVVGDKAEKLSLFKSIPAEKDLVSTIATIMYGSSRVDLFEPRQLADLLCRMYGERFATWSKKDSGSIVDQRIVTKLNQPIEESLVQQYLVTITNSKVDAKVCHSGKAGVCTAEGKRSLPPAAQQQPKATLATPQHRPPGNQASPKSPLPPLTQSKAQMSNDLSLSTSSDVTISRMAPILPIRIFRPNPRLEIAFDVRTKNPVYVLQKLDGLERTKPTVRHPFYEEEKLPVEYRSRLCSFIQSGYDRGHMAPAADFGAESIKDTFNLCNVSPQEKAMNRSTWAKLEHWCRKIAEQELQSAPKIHGKSVFIVTGPVWLPTGQSNEAAQRRRSHLFEFEAIGQETALVHVPTHFFKVIVVLQDKRIRKFACFLVPNQKQGAGASNLEQFLVHWDYLEIITGLQFFPNLVTPNWKQEAKRATYAMMAADPISSVVGQLEHLRVSPVR